LNQQANPFIDPDAAIGGREEDGAFLAVNQSGEAQINREHGVTFSRLPSPNELCPFGKAA
jgi:hypothetical protein